MFPLQTSLSQSAFTESALITLNLPPYLTQNALIQHINALSNKSLFWSEMGYRLNHSVSIVTEYYNNVFITNREQPLHFSSLFPNQIIERSNQIQYLNENKSESELVLSAPKNNYISNQTRAKFVEALRNALQMQRNVNMSQITENEIAELVKPKILPDKQIRGIWKQVADEMHKDAKWVSDYYYKTFLRSLCNTVVEDLDKIIIYKAIKENPLKNAVEITSLVQEKLKDKKYFDKKIYAVVKNYMKDLRK
ncbi:Hypothetical_protein [Hexamita inflata]|uniref:Hypothetical_protein n=1 Tax=Hexamita inflata TaxID=28002 RepID=A0AA86PFY2_9EUKA|nr:Hypothetical protein HINF_LOCUS25061 [Hexamita inflata]